MKTTISVNYWNGKSSIIPVEKLEELNRAPIIKDISFSGIISTIDYEEKWANIILENAQITLAVTSTKTTDHFKMFIDGLIKLLNQRVSIKTSRISKISNRYIRVLDEGLNVSLVTK